MRTISSQLISTEWGPSQALGWANVKGHPQKVGWWFGFWFGDLNSGPFGPAFRSPTSRIHDDKNLMEACGQEKVEAAIQRLRRAVFLFWEGVLLGAKAKRWKEGPTKRWFGGFGLV